MIVRCRVGQVHAFDMHDPTETVSVRCIRPSGRIAALAVGPLVADPPARSRFVDADGIVSRPADSHFWISAAGVCTVDRFGRGGEVSPDDDYRSPSVTVSWRSWSFLFASVIVEANTESGDRNSWPRRRAACRASDRRLRSHPARCGRVACCPRTTDNQPRILKHFQVARDCGCVISKGLRSP